MILLEYIIAQHQEGNESVAIKSRKPARDNPALFIKQENGNVIWEIRGLNLGEVEEIAGQARVTHIDFYIGMEDLIEQRENFPETDGVSLGIPDGIRIPVGTERADGTKIRWVAPVGRILIEDVSAVIPPFKLTKNENSELALHVDNQTSAYPITSEGGNKTKLELHFGIDHDFRVSKNRILKRPNIVLTMSDDEYATVLDYIDNAIQRYNSL
jgi:hypothetical protein